MGTHKVGCSTCSNQCRANCSGTCIGSCRNTGKCSECSDTCKGSCHGNCSGSCESLLKGKDAVFKSWLYDRKEIVIPFYENIGKCVCAMFTTVML